MTSIKDTLQERGAVYGDYESGVILRSYIMDLLKAEYYENNGKEMSKVYQGFLWDQVNKLSRLAVSPDHIDSWHDIQGYAKLVEDTLERHAMQLASIKNA